MIYLASTNTTEGHHLVECLVSTMSFWLRELTCQRLLWCLSGWTIIEFCMHNFMNGPQAMFKLILSMSNSNSSILIQQLPYWISTSTTSAWSNHSIPWIPTMRHVEMWNSLPCTGRKSETSLRSALDRCGAHWRAKIDDFGTGTPPWSLHWSLSATCIKI